MKILGIIPARYASTRFPGKPLAIIHGKTMIQRVYEQACKAAILSTVVVATDDHRIMEEVQRFQGRVLLTSEHHTNGTERCQEVLDLLTKAGELYDVVINIQGDEPLIDPSQIEKIAACFVSEETQIATLAKPITSKEELLSTNCVKVIFNKQHQAIYFSRTPIPYIRGEQPSDFLGNYPYHKHIGLYGFKASLLKDLIALPISPLEKAESLEQLRWVEEGYPIQVAFTTLETPSVDTPEDLLTINQQTFS